MHLTSVFVSHFNFLAIVAIAYVVVVDLCIKNMIMCVINPLFPSSLSFLLFQSKQARSLGWFLRKSEIFLEEISREEHSGWFDIKEPETTSVLEENEVSSARKGIKDALALES